MDDKIEKLAEKWSHEGSKLVDALTEKYLSKKVRVLENAFIPKKWRHENRVGIVEEILLAGTPKLLVHLLSIRKQEPLLECFYLNLHNVELVDEKIES